MCYHFCSEREPLTSHVFACKHISNLGNGLQEAKKMGFLQGGAQGAMRQEWWGVGGFALFTLL